METEARLCRVVTGFFQHVSSPIAEIPFQRGSSHLRRSLGFARKENENKSFVRRTSCHLWFGARAILFGATCLCQEDSRLSAQWGFNKAILLLNAVHS